MKLSEEQYGALIKGRKAKTKPKVKGPSAKSKAEETFALLLDAWGFDRPWREFKFHSERKWRFDFAWNDHMVAVEIEGVVFAAQDAGRHQRAAGFLGDAEKYLSAHRLGWLVVRVPSVWVTTGKYAAQLEMVREVLETELGVHHE